MAIGVTVRDFVCDKLLIPKVAFNEGVIALLEQPNARVALGLTYERITSWRKPFVITCEVFGLRNPQTEHAGVAK